MSLSKQLLLLISTIFLVIFCLNFIISVANIRDYLEIESEVHAQDTATSLGLSLSPHIMDETDPVLETMMNAIFDRGYYREIKLVNVDNKALVTLTHDQVFAEIPSWFITLLPMKTATAKTEISSGWSIAGELYVTINPGYGYLKLFQQARSTFFYSLAAFFVCILLLFLVLRFTLLPLKKIEQLAAKIAESQFATIQPLPWTTEVKNVAVAMNSMSTKIGKVIGNLNAKLKSISQRLQLDDLTGLNKKGTFITDLKQLFMANSEGYVFLIKIDKLADMAKQQGNGKVDEFLVDFATLLKEFSQQKADHKISSYRFYGSEFAMMTQTTSLEKIKSLALALSERLGELGRQYQMEDITHFGIAAFNQFSSTDSILAAAQEAFEQARLVGNNSFSIRQQDSEARSKIEWKDLVTRIIDNNEYQVTFIGQSQGFRSSADKTEIVMEEAFTRVLDEDKRNIPIGIFISLAEKYGKVVDLDLGVTKTVIDYILANAIKHPVTINLSMETVRSTEFRSRLKMILNSHPEISGYLAFSLTAYTAAKDIRNFKEFISFIHDIGAKVMLKRYESQFIALDSLKQFRLDYIRLARELTAGISANTGKQTFLEAIKELCDLLDIQILAENVAAEADFAMVKTTGIHGASR